VRALDIWPENWPAFCVFHRLRTQWNVGPGGVIGLRYESLPLALQIHGVPQEHWPDTLDAIQVMEHETLRLCAA